MILNPSPVYPRFEEKYPIDFVLRNINNESVLYIGDIGQTLHVQITNTSADPITIPQKPRVTAPGMGATPPKPGTFELCLRPGILAHVEAIKVNKLSTDDGWTMDPARTDKDGVVSLLFMNTILEKQTIGPHESRDLILDNVIVSPRGGSRGTLVTLHYEGLLVRKISPLEPGTREQRLTILNHEGRNDLPLHIGFVESNKVLNDGRSPNKLVLRIANTMRPDAIHPDLSGIALRGGKDVAPSRLIFSFVAGGSEMDWALGTDSQAKAIKINDFGALGDMVQASEEGTLKNTSPSILQSAQKDTAKSFATAIKPGPAADSTRKDVDIRWKIWAEKLGECFELTMEPLEPAQLNAGEYIELTFSDIITGHPSGMTNLEVRCKSIPGYWDAQFLCPIEKTLLVIVNGRLKDQSGYLLPVGTVVAYAGKTAPEGWLLCNGKGIPFDDKFKELKSLIGINTPNMSPLGSTVYIVKY